MPNSQPQFTTLHAKWCGCATFVLIGLVLLSNQSKAQTPQNAPEPLTLSTSVLLAEQEPTLGPTLVFEATNNSKEDLVIEEAGVSGSPIAIVKPDGEEVLSFVAVNRLRPLAPLKPGKSVRTKLNIFDIFSQMRLNAPGVYKLCWRVSPQGSNNQYFSNQISVMRDKKTPYRDENGELIIP